MKKCLLLGLVSVSLLTTTVYAFSENSQHNIYHEIEDTYQNCPYHDNVIDCHNCQNYESRQQQDHHHITENTNNYGRHGRHGHHH